ncbi:hypothetical protein L249_2610 [Ophiocordyceps polyrhachis-furcata BCC 54312]|uniref:Uncharacterized protein n=1 Tax=Ophiocordyceps polyrhachis-furcata BCC 54312 TaxID=1330021 RepID=A0A367LSC9_9HYPO|nr:hypothetical protein L249_2610 [Ophiocordyceps polyrhachis-furcata BCC 54312]
MPVDVSVKDVLKREALLGNDPKRKAEARPARLGGHSHIKRTEEISSSKSGQQAGPAEVPTMKPISRTELPVMCLIVVSPIRSQPLSSDHALNPPHNPLAAQRAPVCPVCMYLNDDERLITPPCMSR